MAGFLSFLAPIGESLGGTLQLRQQQQGQDASRKAFGDILAQYGDQYAPLQHALEAGAPMSDVAAMSPLIQQHYQQQRMKEIWSGPGSEEDKVGQMLAEGFDVDKGLAQLCQLRK